MAQSQSHRVRPVDRADNTRKILAAQQADERVQSAREEAVLHRLAEQPRNGADKEAPAERSLAERQGHHPGDRGAVTGDELQTLAGAERRHLFRRDIHREVQPLDAHQPLKARAAHRNAPAHGVFQKGQAPLLQGKGDAKVKQHLRRLTLHKSCCTLVHTLCRYRVVDLVGRAAVLRLVHLQLALDLRDLRQRQLPAQACQDRAVGDGHRLTAHEVDRPRTGKLYQLRGGLPPRRGVIRAYQRAAKHGLDVLVVQLDQVERRGYLAVLLKERQNGGVGNLLGFDVHALGFRAAPVPATLLDPTDRGGAELDYGDAVNEILILFHVVS
ncbi:hypothetical protein INE91_02646 [Phocaeicola vulgatus]|nr:hypothetical protein [Phocaeicola vulgatus]